MLLKPEIKLEKVTDIIGVPQVEDFIGQSTSIFIPTMNFPYIVHIETMGNLFVRYQTKTLYQKLPRDAVWTTSRGSFIYITMNFPHA